MRENGLEFECAGIGKPLEKKDSELDKLTFKYEKALQFLALRCLDDEKYGDDYEDLKNHFENAIEFKWKLEQEKNHEK